MNEAMVAALERLHEPMSLIQSEIADVQAAVVDLGDKVDALQSFLAGGLERDTDPEG